MKMRKSEHFTRSSSSIQGQAFNVKFTDKMFETLFSSLYRYKEAASMRETVCNAIDSHNMRDRMHRAVHSHYASLTPPPQRHSKYLAPKGTKVIVHLPDDMEPWLEFKDFGIGLSLEQIIGEAIPAQDDEVLLEGNMVVKEDEIPDSAEVIGVPAFYEGRLVFRREDGEIIRSPGLYTTLFSSTKEDDDGQIGAFGLGSKSPFAVSDSFTVESRMEGKLHRYLMYLNSSRIPTVDLVTKDLETRDPLPEDTDEFNGLTVKIPIKNSRFSAFSEELIRLGRVMTNDERPIVENAPYGFSWQEISRDHRVNNTFIQKKGQGNTHYAVMGGVSYPIDLSQLEPETATVMDKFPSSYTFFPLGSLNVPPSREDLSYDEYTRETLSEEFKVVANTIMTEKMRELEYASLRGPLALFVEKGKLSEMFGSGFRKMIEKQFPADARFAGGEYNYKVPVEIDRDYNETAPFDSVGKPFTLEHHSEWSEQSSLQINTIESWVRLGTHITVVIEDSVRARNLKLKQLKDKGGVVIIAKPSDRYLTKRNLCDTPAFKNAAELKAYYESWIGVQETTVDYLTFADKFVEHLSDVVTPADVKFMSELEYTVPPVEKDPGLYEYSGYHYDLSKDNEISSDRISDIINSGKKIVYIEVSGHTCIHEINGRKLSEDACRVLRDCMHNTLVEYDEKEVRWLTLPEVMGYYKHVFLARRKSVPMMKKFPEVFVPIDQVFDILKKQNALMVDRQNAKNLLATLRSVNYGMARIKYADHLMRSAFGVIEGRYETMRGRFVTAYNAVCSHMDEQAVQEYRNTLNKAPGNKDYPNFTSFMKVLDKLGFTVTNSKADLDTFRAQARANQIFESVSDVLVSVGFARLSKSETISAAARKKNRLVIEQHRVVRFLAENYKPSAHNPIEDDKAFISVISKRILKA